MMESCLLFAVGTESDGDNVDRTKLSTRQTLHDGPGVDSKPSAAVIKSILELICDESVS